MNKIALTLALAFAPLALFWWGMAGNTPEHRTALWAASLLWILDNGLAHGSGFSLRRVIGGE